MIWRDLKGFEDLYHISECGDVVAKPRRTWSRGYYINRNVRTLKGQPTRDGYIQVPLTPNRGKQKRYLAHRLVAYTFLEPVENKLFVNHKDGNKQNNHRDNLEWCTKSENSKHSFAIGLQCNKGEKHPMHKLSVNDVLSIRSRYNNGESSWKIFKSFNGSMSYTNIKDIIAKRTWSHI